MGYKERIKERDAREKRQKVIEHRWDVFQLITLGIFAVFGIIKAMELILKVQLI